MPTNTKHKLHKLTQTDTNAPNTNTHTFYKKVWFVVTFEGLRLW